MIDDSDCGVTAGLSILETIAFLEFSLDLTQNGLKYRAGEMGQTSSGRQQ